MEMVLVTIPNQYEYDEGMVFNRQDIPPEHLDKCRHLQLRKGDIAVMTYPRSGTTLVSQLISLIMCEDPEEMEEVNRIPIYERIIYIDRKNSPEHDPLHDWSEMRPPRLVKTHLKCGMLQHWIDNVEARIVIVLRNPKDVLVSMFHFYKGVAELGPFSGTWDDFFHTAMAGKTYYGDQFSHVPHLWQQRHRKNVHIMFYEDIVKNPIPQITQLADFLNSPISKKRADSIAEMSNIKSMKANKAVNFEHPLFKNGFEFVRKGEIGEWKNYFTVAQNDVMDVRIKEIYSSQGLNFVYE